MIRALLLKDLRKCWPLVLAFAAFSIIVCLALFQREEVRTSSYGIGAAVIMAGIGIGYLLYGPQPVVVYTGPRPGPAPEMIKRAHRYHGILTSQWDPEIGVFVFYRDGKRCRLPTGGNWTRGGRG